MQHGACPKTRLLHTLHCQIINSVTYIKTMEDREQLAW